MEFAATAERVTELIIQREGGEGYPGFPAAGQVFESAVAAGRVSMAVRGLILSRRTQDGVVDKRGCFQ